MRKIVLLGLAAAGLLSLQTAFAESCDIETTPAMSTAIPQGSTHCMQILGSGIAGVNTKLVCAVFGVTRSTQIEIIPTGNLNVTNNSKTLDTAKVVRVATYTIKPFARGTVHIINKGPGDFRIACRQF